MKLRTLDLFCGAGGLTAGFTAEGFDVLAGVDNNRAACSTHKNNFPNSITICSPVNELPPAAFSAQTGIKAGDVDVIIGGPPCQTFSTIGLAKIKSLKNDHEEKSDIRNYLFISFFEYVKFYQPTGFVMENVPAIKSKYKGKLFDQVQKLVVSLGYSFSSQVLNAADFGVPQQRNRLFIVGLKNGDGFRYPNPTHSAGFCEGLKPYVTVREALFDLPEVEDGSRHHHLPYSTDVTCEYQKLVRSSRKTVGNNVCRMSNERAKKLFTHMRQGQKYMDLPPKVRKILPFREDIFHDRLKRLSEEHTSWTVLAHIGMDGYMYIHPTKNRTLSVREAARLQSFPDSFEFIGNMREQYIQVGNAVPPFLAKAIAKELKRRLK